MQIFAALGSQPDISLEELKVVLKTEPQSSSKTIAVFDVHDEDLSALQRRLGGVQKIGFIHASFPVFNESDIIAFAATLFDMTSGVKQQIGLSMYDAGDSITFARMQSRKEQVGLSIKNVLRQNGMNARYVSSRGTTLSSADILKNKVLENGKELVLIAAKKNVFIGETVDVQDIDEWSHRDIGRPWRNAKQGMLPPKLARIMVNLAGQIPVDRTLLDPFCGSGTVLMEAGLVGYGKLIGSDIAEQAVSDSIKNLDWIDREGFAMPERNLFVSTAANAPAHVPEASVDAIVTEPFLGKPRQGRETVFSIKQEMHALEALYEASFRALKATLKPSAIVIIANPVHFVGGQQFEPDTVAVLQRAGYKYQPFSKDLLYKRNEQFVGRHLLRFTI